MEQLQHPSLVPANSAAAEELRKIAADIQDYMGKWVVRSRRVVAQANDSSSGDVSVSAQKQRLEDQQRKWETRRQREMEDITEKSEELAAAWLKLEAEQRQFLQMKNSMQLGVAQSSPAQPAQPSETQMPISSAEVYAAPPQDVQSVASFDHSTDTSPRAVPKPATNAAYPSVSHGNGHARDAAIRQFEQLRREVAARHGS